MKDNHFYSRTMAPGYFHHNPGLVPSATVYLVHLSLGGELDGGGELLLLLSCSSISICFLLSTTWI